MSSPWTEDRTLLELLESAGPFDSHLYREAWLRHRPALADVSFAARMGDGTSAAVGLVRDGPAATWPPLGYSGVVASGPLSETALSTFLEAARASSGVGSIGIRELAWSGNPVVARGRQVGLTSIIDFGDEEPSAGLAKKARQSVRRAERAGAVAAPVGQDPGRFLGLYQPVARSRGAEYPEDVVRSLAESGAARFYDVLIEGEPVASAMALVGADHWMYWAAAQNDQGRDAEAGYLAALAMLEDAHRSGARAINLGGSSSGGEALEGVAQFKRRLGGRDVPVIERWVATRTARIKRSLADAAARIHGG